MGFIPWDEITVGKDRIPWEKDQQLVLFYQVRVTKSDNKRRKKSTTESKDEQKLPVKG